MSIIIEGVRYTGEILLGHGTSHGEHRNHPDTEHMPPGVSVKTPSGTRKVRCPACRWQEVDIYLLKGDDYLVHTVGRTIVPGESDYVQVTRTDSANQVREALTVRNARGAFLPGPARWALAQAADNDDDLEHVYLTLPKELQ